MEEQKAVSNNKLKNFLATHESLTQLIKFTLFSIIAFAIEYISFAIVKASLKKINQDTVWWIFKYSTNEGGLGAMIAFFVSNVLAQIATFVINRKKTFKATNNVVYSAIMYAIMVCCIIILNTWLGGALTKVLNKSIKSLTACQYIGKLVGSFTSFVISFVMSKFVIMRSPKKKAETVAETK
jgi:putative flippase GtrA